MNLYEAANLNEKEFAPIRNIMRDIFIDNDMRFVTIVQRGIERCEGEKNRDAFLVGMMLGIGIALNERNDMYSEEDEEDEDMIFDPSLN